MKLALNYAARTDQGRVRHSNQDSAYAGPHLLVLADGMGGPAGGDIASTIAIHQLRQLDDDSFLATDMGNQLAEAINAAHSQIVAAAAQDPSLEGLGTTCTAIIRSGDLLSLAHIGDSRAYLLRRGILTQETTDHSFVQYLIQQGQLTPEQAANHPQRSVLLRVLGDTQGRVELDRSTSQAQLGDRWLLCSDGLSGVVAEEDLHRILQEQSNPDSACEKLIEAALAAGGPDNITCVVADFVDEDVVSHIPTASLTVGAAAHADEHGRVSPSTTDIPTAEIPTDDEDEDEDAPADLEQTAEPLHEVAPEAPAPVSAPSPTPATPAQKCDAAEEKRGHKKFWVSLVLALIVVALAAFGARQGVAYMRSGWTLTTENHQVVLYHGTPESLGPIKLYTKREVLREYTMPKGPSACTTNTTSTESTDPSTFANPHAQRVITCAALRAMEPSLEQDSRKQALAWLETNSDVLVIATQQPDPAAAAMPQTDPEAGQ